MEGLDKLVRVATELGRPRTLEANLQAVADVSLSLLEADHASIRVCDASARLRSLARSGVGSTGPAPEFRKGQGLMGWAVQEGRPVRVSDSPADERFAPTPNRGYDVRSVMSIPLCVGDRVLGALSVSAAKKAAFTSEHEQAGLLIAHCVGQALRCAELERLATTDALTRAYNRSHLLPCLSTEMNRARRESKPLSVLLMDLDHFKAVNDRYGHAVGDQVLCRFAEVVRGCVRSFDVLVRRGGEEFELIMPGTTTVEGWRVAERIRSKLARDPLSVRADLQVPQTVSVGLATWDGHETAEALDQRADLAMYEAKRKGRDRTVAASMPRGVDVAPEAERAPPAAQA